MIRQDPLNPLLNVIVLAAGNAPHATVIAAGAVIVGSAAGETVIVLDTDARALPHASVAVHVSVIGPPQGPGIAENVEGLEVPEIRHEPVNPFVNGIVLAAGNAPQATVIAAGAVIVGNAAGVTVIVLVTGASALPHASVAVHVSVIVPPQGPGAADNVEVLEVPVIRQDPLRPFV